MGRRSMAALLAAAPLVWALSGCAGSPTDRCDPLVVPNADGDVTDPSSWIEDVRGHASFLVPPPDAQGRDFRESLDLGEASGDYLEYRLTEATASADPTLDVAFDHDRFCVVEQRELGGGLAATAMWVFVAGSLVAPAHAQAIVALTAPGTDAVRPVTVGEGDDAYTVRFSFYVPFSGDDAGARAIDYLHGDSADMLLDVLETVSLAP